MRRNFTKMAIVISIAVVVIIWMIVRLVTSIGTGVGGLCNNPDRYKYGVPLQHVAEIHYMEIGDGLTTESGYPVYETAKDGWVVYTVRTKSGDVLKEIVFNGPEFWNEVKKGKFEDTNNWQE